jgi:DNA processing protein
MTSSPRPRFSEPPDFADAPPPDDTARARLVEALSPVPADIDELIRHTGLHPAQVHLVLLELDLAGRLERHAGGMVSLLPAGA